MKSTLSIMDRYGNSKNKLHDCICIYIHVLFLINLLD